MQRRENHASPARVGHPALPRGLFSTPQPDHFPLTRSQKGHELSSNLFTHPLTTPTWELEPASTARLHTRSLWTQPSEAEPTAPDRRIIHSRVLFTDRPSRIDTVSIGAAPGYHKCASGQERDAILDLGLFVPDGDDWREVGRMTGSAERILAKGATIDLGGLYTTALVAQARRAATDEWWPGWNLVATGIEVSGEIDSTWEPTPQGSLSVESVVLTDLPADVTATLSQTEVRFRTPYLDVGFRLITPAWSHLGIDADGTGRTDRNLLQMPRSMDIVRSGVYPSGVYPVLRDQNAEYLAQGPRFTDIGGAIPLGFLHSDLHGSTSVVNNRVRYDLFSETAGQSYILEFRVEADRIHLHAERSASQPRRAWTSSAWHVATDNRVTPSEVLGTPTFAGETGLMTGPTTWHFPRHGTLSIATTGDALWRSDSVRPLDTNTLELKLGETPTEFGDYVLPAGTFSADVEMAVHVPLLARLDPGASPAIRRMIERHTLTALSFRADTTTYSNNGASMHCTTSLADVSAIATHLDDSPGITPMKWVGDSLQRWLDGAPSYGSGATSHGPHRLEDEYVHMAANTLTAAARFVQADPGGHDWFESNRTTLVRELESMLARDVDDDGLVESTLRLGISGQHQWSTAWADVISFGWKDAWANAVTYEMWQLWEPALRLLGEGELADRIRSSREKLREAYLPTFLNPETGLIAGWRSKDGFLHDHGFSIVNGAAAASDLLTLGDARSVMEALIRGWNSIGLTDFRNGIPLNLWRIPESDIGGVIFGLPMGGYQQGGYSHHGARVIVDALDRTGLTEHADTVLEGLATTIADDTSFGGLGSGRDWRMADGTPSGYEGQLIEGFSVMASALRRYRR